MTNRMPLLLTIVFCGALLAAYSNASAEKYVMKRYPLYAHSGHDMEMNSGHAEEPAVDLKIAPSAINAGTPETITFSFRDSEGKPLKEMALTHERILHVVIASQDFSEFSHIHPEDFGPVTEEMKEKAAYSVKYTFPKAGRYIIGIDFADKNEAYSRHFIEEAGGGPGMNSAPSPDFSRKKRFADLDVTLSTEPETITAGKKTDLVYRFEKNGKAVTDLQPYIAAIMHASVISTDLKQFIHEHGSVPGMPEMEMHGHHMMHDMLLPEAFGPEIRVPVTFPQKGTYVIYGEVQHQGKVVRSKFMVEVK